MPSEKFAESSDTIAQITRALEHEIAIPVMHGPQTFVYPLDQFYDSSYHLTQAAGYRRSTRIGESLLRLQARRQQIATRDTARRVE